eukprot:TRINITY_DN2124_c0_g1_i1.p3 TRINITY_DN2124_c0_g1~~TRINITY_DN2124_c0_g1_i1.p3  ORF type:complete len:66 (+),score=0.58 TRINITY_DN2124_c0_g1_i1:325-522(+)
MSFAIWDFGGRSKIRPLWRHYFPNTHGLAWVVDSGDRGRIEGYEDSVYEELYRVLADDEMRGYHY